jgi:PAS domain S-box-containing protein
MSATSKQWPVTDLEDPASRSGGTFRTSFEHLERIHREVLGALSAPSSGDPEVVDDLSRCRAASDGHPVAVAIAHGLLVYYANPAYLRLFDRSESEVLGQDLLLSIAPEDRARIVARPGQADGHRIPNHYIFDGLKKGGVRFRVEVLWSTARVPGGALTTIAVFQDLSEATLAEEAIRESERFLSDVFASIQDGVSILDLNYTVLRTNPILERWYAHSLPLVGKKCHEVYHQASEPCAVCPSREVMRTGKAAVEVVPFEGPDKQIMGWQELFAFPFLDTRTGELKGVIEYVRDISARRRAELALEERNRELVLANAKLESLHRTKDQIVAMASHELRTPLVTGLGYIDLLLDGAYGAISGKIATRMRTAQKNLRRLSVLIDGMLGYRRLLEQDHPNLSPVDVSRLLFEAHGEFLVRSGRDPSRSAVEVSPGVGAVLADGELISRVLANLLDNAAVHAGSGAFIRIAARPAAEGRIAISVADDGNGFPPDIKERAFEPFIRSTATREGCGLGLAIVTAILRAHRSEAVLESEAGRGSRIEFLLEATEGPHSTT